MKKYTKEQFDEFCKAIGLELFEYQKEYLYNIINADRPLVLLFPRHLGYTTMKQIGEAFGRMKNET